MLTSLLWWIMVPKLQRLWYLFHLIVCLIHQYKTKYCDDKYETSRLLHLNHIIIHFRFAVLHGAWFFFLWWELRPFIKITLLQLMFFVSVMLCWGFSVKSASQHSSCNSFSILLSQVSLQRGWSQRWMAVQRWNFPCINQLYFHFLGL